MPEGAPTQGAASEEIGQVIAYYGVPRVAMVEIRAGTLKLGDKIWIRGHTTDVVQDIRSMQWERQPVSEAKAGQQVGIQMEGKARQHDRVYKIA